MQIKKRRLLISLLRYFILVISSLYFSLYCFSYLFTQESLVPCPIRLNLLRSAMKKHRWFSHLTVC